jgi:PIN domain nuclease of toxin-antitoxin system
LWWVSDPRKLSRPASAAIEQADTIAITAISCWEVGMLVELGRIALDRPVEEWIAQALGLDRAGMAETSWRAGVRASQLGRSGFHGDPADRLIYATARDHACPLVSKDERLRAFDSAVIW